jgi:integrase
VGSGGETSTPRRSAFAASDAAGKLTTPKSGKVRAVPIAPDVASALARIGQRVRFTGEDDFVFAGEAGLPLNGAALSSRYERALNAAGRHRLRFHDLRHTSGTRMIREADIHRVQERMGHADIQTTMKYLHDESRKEDAELVARAFATSTHAFDDSAVGRVKRVAQHARRT